MTRPILIGGRGALQMMQHASGSYGPTAAHCAKLSLRTWHPAAVPGRRSRSPLDELERKAVASGMPKPVSDAERPSSWTLQRLANNFSLGGKHLHVEWESYVSLEKEERATRSGKSLKSHPAVFLVGGKTLEVQEQEVELDGVHKVTGLVSMQETWS